MSDSEQGRWGSMRVGVQAPARPPVPGTLIRFDVLGANAMVRLPSSGGIPLGRLVDVRFYDEQGTTVAKISARSTFGEEQGEFRAYRFQFGDTHEEPFVVPSKLRWLMERRGAIRVRPSRVERVQVILDPGWGPQVVTGALYDICARGLSVRTGLEAEDQMADSRAIRASFRLPGQMEPMGLGGEIRFRQVMGEELIYGIEFDRDEAFERNGREIMEYIQARSGKVDT